MEKSDKSRIAMTSTFKAQCGAGARVEGRHATLSTPATTASKDRQRARVAFVTDVSEPLRPPFRPRSLDVLASRSGIAAADPWNGDKSAAGERKLGHLLRAPAAPKPSPSASDCR
jgi:hypothetical protein